MKYLITIILLLPIWAYANCQCTCINGVAKRVCEDGRSLPGGCPQNCPQIKLHDPAETQGNDQLINKPCRFMWVIDPQTHQREWRRVCS